jgi:RND family efflux transporter MFP subunit
MSQKQPCRVFAAGQAALFFVPALCALPASGGEPKGARVVFQTSGFVVPIKLVTVSAQVSGQVVKLNAVEGQTVKKGDVLARLDDTVHKARVEAAKAKVEIATEQLDKLKGSTNRQDVAIARAKVRQAKAKLDIAQWQLAATVIRAPLAGTILAKKTEEGNVVAPLGHICEMANLRELEVEVVLQERDVSKVVKGQACVIHLDAFPKVAYKGQVSRLMPVADRARGAVPVRVKIEVPDKDARLRLEMRAMVKFLGMES